MAVKKPKSPTYKAPNYRVNGWQYEYDGTVREVPIFGNSFVSTNSFTGCCGYLTVYFSHMGASNKHEVSEPLQLKDGTYSRDGAVTKVDKTEEVTTYIRDYMRWWSGVHRDYNYLAILTKYQHEGILGAALREAGWIVAGDPGRGLHGYNLHVYQLVRPTAAKREVTADVAPEAA